MRNQRFWTIACAMTVFALLALPASSAQAQEKLSFSIVSGGTGGVWYPLGGAIGGLIGQKVPNTDASSEATTAAIDNLKLLAAGRAGMAFCYDYHVVWANEGKVPGLSGKPNVRLVLGFYEQPLHIVTTEGTGIKTIMDLKGKRVSVGAPNSGTEEQADYVLKALGIDWNKDFTREKLGATESVAALKDGKIAGHVLERGGAHLLHHRSRIDPRPEDGAGARRRRGPGEDFHGQSRGFSQERL